MTSKFDSVKTVFAGISIFAVLSLIGWGIDFGVYSLLVMVLDLTPGMSNYFSSLCGASFAFISFTFYLKKPVLLKNVIAYILYQVISISFYSLLIGFLAQFLHSTLGQFFWPDLLDLAAKVIITPLNFLSNFFVSKPFMSLFGAKPLGE